LYIIAAAVKIAAATLADPSLGDADWFFWANALS
jgi:hypothetical protein